MSWKDNCPRPYYKKYERVPVKIDNNWFEVYSLPGDVYAIAEPKHCQEMNSYLIIGSKRALLFDTGEGFFDIKALAEELYDGEILVINSHSHFDHIGCNYMFDKIMAFADAQAVYTAQKGAPCELFADQLGEEMFLDGYPKGLSLDNFSLPPYDIKPIVDGEIIDLGNRTLKVIHTPGHSTDSIMLFDRPSGILFTGDTFYLAALYAHFDCKEFGTSNLNDYAASLDKIVKLGDDVKVLYCSHNEFVAKPQKLAEAAHSIHQIINGEIKDGTSVGIQHVYLEDGRGIQEYIFDGYSIVCKV